MYSRQLIIEHHSESLDNLTGAVHSGLDTVHKTLSLCFKMSREQALYPYDWSIAVAEGQPPRQVSDLVSESIRSSAHLLTDHYAELVRLFEAQLHVLSQSAHRALDQIQHWSPRGIESTLGHIDCVVDAAEASADQLADASLEIARTMEGRLSGEGARSRSEKRSRTA